MRNLQLELGLVKGRECRSTKRRGPRPRRGHEWFERMRQIVDTAVDWEESSAAKDHSIMGGQAS